MAWRGSDHYCQRLILGGFLGMLILYRQERTRQKKG